VDDVGCGRRVIEERNQRAVGEERSPCSGPSDVVGPKNRTALPGGIEKEMFPCPLGNSLKIRRGRTCRMCPERSGPLATGDKLVGK
jgi:hypothetical protein